MRRKKYSDIYKCEAYACYLKETKELQKSTSGGAFFVLAKKVIMQHGVVFGAAFSHNHRVEHIVATNLNELEELRKSKYVQSKIGNAYINAREHLENNRVVLFSGTPCQIAGLRSFLNKEYDNLLTVDLICHGVPSQKLLCEHIKRLENDKGRISRIQFRDKENGWSNVSVSYQMENYKHCVKAYEDAYFYGFDKYYYLRPSCYECSFRGLKSGADITIGDYWGIQKEHPDFWNDSGISAVIIKSEKGAKCFESCKEELVWCNSTVEKIANYNIFVTSTVGQKKSRTLFFKEYLGNKRDLFEVFDDMAKQMSIIKIGIIGSYSSRKAVHSVKSYNEGVEIEWQITSSSICSMMSNAVDLTKLTFLELSDNNPYRKQAVCADLRKEIKNKVEEIPCDYLVIDFLEERHPIACLQNGQILTFSDMFEEFCNKNKLEKISKTNMLDVSFEFWKEKCDKFINLLKASYKPEQIILNRIYLTEYYGMYQKENSFSNIDQIKVINRKLKTMYDYFIQHFDGIHSICIDNDETNYCFEKFEYGCEAIYYNKQRYSEMKNEIIKIMENKSEKHN